MPEVARLRDDWAQRKAELKDTARLREFTEQLNREWAIETGVIENLYDIERGVTQTLIERGFQAALLEHGATDKDREFVLALLQDQQAALENLFAFVKQDRQLSTGYIRELHAMMTRSQATTIAHDPKGNRTEVELLHGEWKKHRNFPKRDGIEYRYCPPEQTASEMERLVEVHQRHVEVGVPPEVEAAWLHHRFTQIHPFQDGNGRVARAMASLVLIRAGLFPLVVPRDEKDIYLESLEHADQGSLRSLVLLTARRQQVAYRKAMTLLDKLAPEAETASEAAEMLGRLFAKDQGVIKSRLEDRIQQLHSWVYNELRDQAARKSSELRRAAGLPDVSAGGGFGGGGGPAGPSIEVLGANEKDQYLRAVRPAMMDRWGVIPSPPCDCFRIVVRLTREFHVLVHLHSLNPETDEAVQAAALLVAKETIQALDVQPLTWASVQSAGDFQSSVPKWIEEVFRTGLTAVRRPD